MLRKVPQIAALTLFFPQFRRWFRPSYSDEIPESSKYILTYSKLKTLGDYDMVCECIIPLWARKTEKENIIYQVNGRRLSGFIRGKGALAKGPI